MSVHADQTREYFNRLYKEVSESVAAARNEVAALKIDHDDGRKEVVGMVDKLQSIQNRFDSELDLLAQNAEWDKFTIAFFGETNAGKSTIIDSLRILFNEESRKRMLVENSNDLKKYEDALAKSIDNIREAIKSVYETHAEDLKTIKRKTTVLSGILEKESKSRLMIAGEEAAARTKIANEESLERNRIIESETIARLRIEEQEAAAMNRLANEESLERNRILETETFARISIAKEESSVRMRNKLIWIGIGCFVAGSALSSAIAVFLTRH
ncbi:hypothetical protein [Leptothrix ochracea]|uniref:hypothetical protein n=1 Tax=Leptothrix ochracea TaxID=735331 RepID=UPI0034E1F6F0